MENNQKLTIWQRLNKTMDDPQDVKQFINPEPEKEILKTKSKEEYEFEKLQMQQTKYIENTWEVVQNKQFEKAMVVNPNRLSGYYDYEAMEQMPEISAALDIFADSITTQNEKGRILSVFSNNQLIKEILEDLFYKKLNLETNLYAWARNLVKYGENFVYLEINREKGIVGCEQLPNAEIQRFEKTLISQSKKVDRTKFFWETNGNMELEQFQVLHFRLTGDDKLLPYGVSHLAKVRRIFKLLMLAEDSILINRLTRASDRRIFKVFVGNMDPKDSEPYIQRIANKFKRTPMVDPKTGQLDLRYNLVGQDQDIFIPVRESSNTNVVENLQGSTNLDNIQDIKYFQNKMLTALRVPRAFITFDSDSGGAAGDGKNLALMDIRFANTVQHMQKALIMELNKAAIVHLFLLGYEEELENFTLTLTNPSLQSDVLKLENWKEKIQLFKDATTPVSEGGMAPMSYANARKRIFSESEKEIREDLLEQRFEKALNAELANTAQIIPKTNFFDDVDKLFKTKQQVAPQQQNPSGGGVGGGSMPSFGGGGGLGDMGSSTPDLGDDLTGGLGDMNMGGETPNLSGAEATTPEAPNTTPAPEEEPNLETSSINAKFNLLKEQKQKQIIENTKLTSTIDNLLKDIDKLINE